MTITVDSTAKCVFLKNELQNPTLNRDKAPESQLPCQLAGYMGTASLSVVTLKMGKELDSSMAAL